MNPGEIPGGYENGLNNLINTVKYYKNQIITINL